MIKCNDPSVGELRREARRRRDAKQVRRWLGLALALEGFSRETAAKASGMMRQTFGKSLEIWFQDEARVGQKGALTRV